MDAAIFVDYYGVLEISPSADEATIERMFRFLAHRYHPDNPETGDSSRFHEIVEAHNAIRDPVKRAHYDMLHRSRSGEVASPEEPGESEAMKRDIEIQARVLSIFYARRRQSVNDAGVDAFSLERMAGCPREHLEFHLWYMQQKGWIARDQDGVLAITVEGVDRANSEYQRKATIKLLTDGHPGRDI